jgi:chemotaxis protein MotB
MLNKKVRKVEGGGAKMEQGSGRWMLTYLDMVTLLFGEFIILFAMANVNHAKVQQVAESLRMGFQGGWTIYNQNKSGGITFREDLKPEGTKEKQLFNKFQSILKAEINKHNIHVREEEGAIIITLVGDVYFASGSDQITTKTEDVLNRVYPVLNDIDYYIRIEGHTDEIQADENVYQDNWQLGAMRAVNILRYLEIAGIDPGKLSASTYGQYKPIFVAPQDTPEARAIERRVDIVIPTDKHYIYYKKK